MADIEKQRKRLIELLKRLFQLDQPDLDFGFYRIMHAKAGQVSKFLEEDLLSIIHEKFGESNKSRIAEAKASYEEAVQQAKDYGAPDPEATEAVKKAKSALTAVKDSNNTEGEIYDHLYRFFERYYDNGDFMSLRYFVRETDGRAAPYAVPYDGREVYLHWANRDQYYIKTSEHLTNFTFDPTSAKEFKEHHGELFKNKSLKVHCRIISASEGEHNNVKANEQAKRYFIIHKDEPLKLEVGESGETDLVIQFEFRPDPEKSGQEGKWRKKRLVEANDTINEAFSRLSGVDDFVKALLTPAPTEKEEDRTLLEKYLLQYTARNTMDYFIHKDLGGFLRRELDFYIKNEVMRLDDIETAEVHRVEGYLAKIGAFRTIAGHLIDFLVQLEEFQKKLWLKKKFVMETHYCVTLDRVPESFYEEIGKNKEQIEEWKKLFAIETLEGCGEVLDEDFLKSNCHLVLDTSLFSEDFKCRLLSTFEDIDQQTDGILIHSENFQALNLLRKKYEERVRCIYIDPPYNTGRDNFIYRDNYKHSSWMTLISQSSVVALSLMRKDALFFFTIGDLNANEGESPYAALLLKSIFPNRFGTLIWKKRGSVGHFSEKNMTEIHDYIHVFSNSDGAIYKNILSTTEINKDYKEADKNGKYKWMNFLGASQRTKETNPNMAFGVLFDKKTLEIKELHSIESDKKIVLSKSDGEMEIVYPPSTWMSGMEAMEEHCKANRVRICPKHKTVQIKKYLLDAEGMIAGKLLKSILSENSIKVGMNEEATKDIKGLFGLDYEDIRPKPVSLVKLLSYVSTKKEQDTVLDYFSGSGTTGHAVINLNREDEGRRKYILVEMGKYFDTVLKPRIQKVIYSRDWKDGKPVSREGSSHCFKYIRLESYEDVLNNLALNSAPELKSASSDFVKDYMLRYWLDVETKDSPSLLNIKDFTNPTAYILKVKKLEADEYAEKAVDLIETFNWLVGLHVEHIDKWRGYDASFKREKDPELPKDTNTRLIISGNLRETDSGAWQLRKIEGYTLRTPGDSSDRERVLVIWRKLTGDTEQDNLVLDEWFKKYRLSSQDSEFDIIYVNGSNNLPNLRQEGEKWKVRLIEEAFHQTMWDVEG